MQCNGVTSRKRRCKFTGRYIQSAYGVNLNVCKHHLDGNCIYEWSNVRNEETPLPITNFLNMFWTLMNTSKLKSKFILAICSKLHNLSSMNLSTDLLVDLFYDTVLERAEEIECPICVCEHTTSIKLHCNHVFCEDCIKTWMNRNPTCPLCRADV